MRGDLMRTRFGVALLLAIVLVCSAWRDGAAPGQEHVQRYPPMSAAEFSVLRDHAAAFARAQAAAGFTFEEAADAPAAFQIHCYGVLAMAVENQPSQLRVSVPADALYQAPQIVRLQTAIQRWRTPWLGPF